MLDSVYHTKTPVVNTLTWPVVIRTEDVEFLVANLAPLGATIEVGPSVTHPRNYNRLILPDGASYITRGSTHWTLEDAECSCYDLPDGRAYVCAACKRRMQPEV